MFIVFAAAAVAEDVVAAVVFVVDVVAWYFSVSFECEKIFFWYNNDDVYGQFKFVSSVFLRTVKM